MSDIDIVQQLYFRDSRLSTPQFKQRKPSNEIITKDELDKQLFRAHPDYHYYYFSAKTYKDKTTIKEVLLMRKMLL